MSKKILTALFLLAWLSQAIYLFPIPDFGKLGSTDTVQATIASGWIITAVLIAFGLVAGIVGPSRRIGLLLMLLSSLSYIVSWWIFSGYFDVNISIGKLFADLWSAAKISGRQAIFLHRDVLLLVFYHVVLVFLAFYLYRWRIAKVTTS
jgi:hypothetical protein